jgi:hypothetical protein
MTIRIVCLWSGSPGGAIEDEWDYWILAGNNSTSNPGSVCSRDRSVKNRFGEVFRFITTVTYAKSVAVPPALRKEPFPSSFYISSPRIGGEGRVAVGGAFAEPSAPSASRAKTPRGVAETSLTRMIFISKGTAGRTRSHGP